MRRVIIPVNQYDIDDESQNTQLYTVGHKKRRRKLFATTFANIDRFR